MKLGQITLQRINLGRLGFGADPSTLDAWQSVTWYLQFLGQSDQVRMHVFAFLLHCDII